MRKFLRNFMSNECNPPYIVLHIVFKVHETTYLGFILIMFKCHILPCVHPKELPVTMCWVHIALYIF